MKWRRDLFEWELPQLEDFKKVLNQTQILREGEDFGYGKMRNTNSQSNLCN